MARSVLLYLSLFLSILSPLAIASNEIVSTEVVGNEVVVVRTEMTSNGMASTETASDEKTNKDKVPLRVLPLGASITWGKNSATGNGYRKPLRDQLTSGRWEVDMVGSRHNGDMKDNVRYPRSSNLPSLYHIS